LDLNTVRQLNEWVEREAAFVQPLRAEISKVIVGQVALIERVLIAVLSDGHILLEGVPGLAKTLLVKTISQAIQAKFSRIQFTPDLLPADLLGTQIYNPKTGDFTTRKGPIFANLILADEINRAPAKVQSALLEAMQERQVTISTETYSLGNFFLVLATQNPIEQEGTYPLPEAQIDRFMFKINVTYPARAEERLMLDRQTGLQQPSANPVITPTEIIRARQVIRQLYVDDKIKEYVIDIVTATRQPAQIGLANLQPLLDFGASPRAGLFLIDAARAHAFLKGRGFVLPEDVKQVAADVLRHRIILNYEAEAQKISSDQIIQHILGQIKVP
jgi:MoxR-like ATPase